MPGRYVIGTNGVVAYAEVNPITPAGPTRSADLIGDNDENSCV